MAMSPQRRRQIESEARAAGMTVDAYLDQQIAEAAAEVARLEAEDARLAAKERRIRSEAHAGISELIDEIEGDATDPKLVAELREAAQKWADPDNKLG